MKPRSDSETRLGPKAPTDTQTIFLLSPAHCGGKRARGLLEGGATSALGARLRGRGATIGDVFSFLSGLYFRGKLAYARRFTRHHRVPDGVLVITPGRGLVAADATVTLDDLRAIAEVGVVPDEPRFREPLERDAG